jgi:Cu/Ag efflux protein CusF
MRTLTFALALSLVFLLACSRNEPKRYEMKGEVVKLDPASQVATVKHEKIGDWMDAMTMEFPVKPPSEFAKLSPGDQITGVVVVMGTDYHLTDIKVAGKKAENPK